MLGGDKSVVQLLSPSTKKSPKTNKIKNNSFRKMSCFPYFRGTNELLALQGNWRDTGLPIVAGMSPPTPSSVTSAISRRAYRFLRLTGCLSGESYSVLFFYSPSANFAGSNSHFWDLSVFVIPSEATTSASTSTLTG